MNSCTTTQKSTGVGGGLGAVIGFGVGKYTGRPVLGATIGGVLGAIGGGVFGNELEKKKTEKANLQRAVEAENSKGGVEGDLYQGHYRVVEKRRWVEPTNGETKGHWAPYEEKVWIPYK